MSREIKIHLPEAQCDALAAEAKAAGRSFFDHCRAKLLHNTATTVVHPDGHQVTHVRMDTHAVRDQNVLIPHEPKSIGDSRIDRLEAMMMQMANAIQNLANPQHTAQDQPIGDADFADVVTQSLEAAEQMPVDREDPEPRAGGVRPVGQRMVSRLAVGNVPSHVAGLFPS